MDEDEAEMREIFSYITSPATDATAFGAFYRRVPLLILRLRISAVDLRVCY